MQYTTGKYEISRRENRCILKIKNAGKEDHNAEFACTVEGDKTACIVNVEGQFDPQIVRNYYDTAEIISSLIFRGAANLTRQNYHETNGFRMLTK